MTHVADVDLEDDFARPADPLKGEKSKDHRAFLLWGMQSGPRRNLRAVGRIYGMPEATVRYRQNKYRWKERINQMGHLADVICARMYRARYFPHYKHSEIGRLGVPVASFGADMVPDSPVIQAALNAAQEAAYGELGRKREQGMEALNDIEQIKTVCRKVVRQFARKLDVRIDAKGKAVEPVEITAAGAARWAELLTRVQHAIGGLTVQGAEIAEPRRVSWARKHGGDVLEALQDHIEEVMVVVYHLRVSRESGESVLDEPTVQPGQ